MVAQISQEMNGADGKGSISPEGIETDVSERKECAVEGMTGIEYEDGGMSSYE